MKLVIKGHPARRMQERGVTAADIENAIRRYHTSLPGWDGGVAYLGPGANGATLKVWTVSPGFVDEQSPVIIKSVAWADVEDRT